MMDFSATPTILSPDPQPPQDQASELSHQQQQQEQSLQQSQGPQSQSQSFGEGSFHPQHQPQSPFTAVVSSEQQQQQQQQQQSQGPSNASQSQHPQSQQPFVEDAFQHQDVFNTDASQRPQAFGSEPHHQPQPGSFGSPMNPSAVGSSAPEYPPVPQQTNEANVQSGGDPQFDIFEWYPKFQSCQRYFVDHAQQSGHVQAVAAFVNISLPFQRSQNPVPGSPPRLSPGTLAPPPALPPHQSPQCVSLIPYLRRLVVTGLDFPGVLHGFFGDDWATGVGPLHEQERRNYLFAAKSGGWASVKRDYDMLPLETVPFMRPLQGPVIAEIEAAEKSWSEWLAMEDWMVGPRAPENMDHRNQMPGN